MRINSLHGWQVTVTQAQDIQRRLAALVSDRNEVGTVNLVAGVDISPPNPNGVARGAVVVLRYPELTLAETKVAEQKLGFPYVPGLLSFRESPLILAAFEMLSIVPDLIFVDGQGLAHPRRLGIACHLGLILDIATIGCAKSILCGRHDPIGPGPGSHAELIDRGETVGAALRTKERATPIYVSIGHKVDLKAALGWVMTCCHGYRVPEPTRLAHLAAAGNLAEGKADLKKKEQACQVRLSL